MLPAFLSRVRRVTIGLDDDYGVRKILIWKVNNFLLAGAWSASVHPIFSRCALPDWMSRQQVARSIQHSDPWMTDRMESYCILHPRSPSAIRRPQLSRRRGTFVVLLGHSLENGVVGIGNTVENALRAFDLQYLRAFEAQPDDNEIVRRRP